jgi:hypothetical protein
MTRAAAVSERPANADLETSKPAQSIGSAPRPQASRGSGGATIDLLLVHSPIAHPLPPRHGIQRWEYAGRIYREVPLANLYAHENEENSTPNFRQMDSLMRARPYRGAA